MTAVSSLKVSADTAPVSVVMPCFRCTDTIARAVESVASQTLRPAEIVLVDDASGDDTLSMLEGLAARYGRDWIRVVALTKNGGPGTARNAGWERATQTFIAFLDADDAWHPRKIELQYAWMSEHPDVAMTGHGSALAMPGVMETTPPADMAASRVRPWQMLISNRFPTRSVMLRRDLPIRFHNSKRYAEDYLLWLEIILGGMEVWRLNVTLAFCFRPEFSAGGYSGNLWIHECRELNTYSVLRRKGLIAVSTQLAVGALSLLKFFRRIVIALVRKDVRKSTE